MSKILRVENLFSNLLVKTIVSTEKTTIENIADCFQTYFRQFSNVVQSV